MNLSELEMVAARAVYAAHAFERALHDCGPWTMGWGPHVVPATRTVQGDGVMFWAKFPEVCWISQPQDNITLMCRDQISAVRPIEFPGDTAFSVTWKLSFVSPDLTATL